ncbi:MAG: hypothetical protein AAF570_01750, partial [Bacteroidota bacterium]
MPENTKSIPVFLIFDDSDAQLQPAIAQLKEQLQVIVGQGKLRVKSMDEVPLDVVRADYFQEAVDEAHIVVNLLSAGLLNPDNEAHSVFVAAKERGNSVVPVYVHWQACFWNVLNLPAECMFEGGVHPVIRENSDHATECLRIVQHLYGLIGMVTKKRKISVEQLVPHLMELNYLEQADEFTRLAIQPRVPSLAVLIHGKNDVPAFELLYKRLWHILRNYTREEYKGKFRRNDRENPILGAIAGQFGVRSLKDLLEKLVRKAQGHDHLITLKVSGADDILSPRFRRHLDRFRTEFWEAWQDELRNGRLKNSNSSLIVMIFA